jgi:hypothetical protein
MKVVINTCYGGFSLSILAQEEYLRRKGVKIPEKGAWDRFFGIDDYEGVEEIDRTDPVLVSIVEEMGDRADGKYAELKVVEIPDGIQWSIHQYDGIEWIAEAHRTWS